MSRGKARLRAWAKQMRAEVDLRSVSRLVVGHLRDWEHLAGTVLTYFALPDEVDLAGLMDHPRVDRWVATRTPRRGGLTLHHVPAEMETHRLGFRQPVAEAPAVPVEAVDVALVPGLLFDRRGNRLGRGGGHFDGLLIRLSGSSKLVGVAPSPLVVRELPIEEHDVRMTHLATENGVSSVAATGEG